MATTIVSNPNMVVTPAPDPPGFYSYYASKSSFALGGIQIGVGVLTSLISVIVLATFGSRGAMAGIVAHLIFGIITIAAGSLGIAAGKFKTIGPIVGFMVMSIIASIFAVYAFFAFAIAAAVITVAVAGLQYAGVVTAVVYIFVIVYLLESIASIWSAAICCNVACCGRRQTTGVIVGYPPQTSHVVVVNPGQMQQQQQPFEGMASPPYPGQGATASPGNQVSYSEPPPKY
ncbi:hypothetical protein LSAT2_029898 [Lamellibrachia satsuma]|nr:hypothetical protein LSAT2_029898 [Lamellibrachia satsuma]